MIALELFCWIIVVWPLGLLTVADPPLTLPPEGPAHAELVPCAVAATRHVVVDSARCNVCHCAPGARLCVSTALDRPPRPSPTPSAAAYSARRRSTRCPGIV